MGDILLELEGTGEIKSLGIVIKEDKVILDLNNVEVPVNPFVPKIITNTVSMVSSFKGMSEISKINISVFDKVRSPLIRPYAY